MPYTISVLVAAALAAQFPLTTSKGLEVINVKAEPATYRGKQAIRLLDAPGSQRGGEQMAVIDGSDFKDGTIEVEIASAPRSGASATARGFAGIAFRIQPQGSRFECFYLRPTNGRADDQLRRNHSAQYVASPDFPWERLRKETPGVYESYVDLEPGVWTKVKIVVAGVTARLYVNGADQPCLIVNDLKLGESRGKIALWIGPDTDAYFTNLTVR
jgi:hypothetical protein